MQMEVDVIRGNVIFQERLRRMEEDQGKTLRIAQICKLDRGGDQKRLAGRQEKNLHLLSRGEFENCRVTPSLKPWLPLGSYTSVLTHLCYICLSLAHELCESRSQVGFVFVPRSGVATRFPFICQAWEFWAVSRVFAGQCWSPWMISDTDSASEAGGSLLGSFHLCIRCAFIHYSTDIYWEPNMAEEGAWSSSQCLSNKC